MNILKRRQAKGLLELRLVVPDPHSKAVRQRVSRQVADLSLRDEHRSLDWIEGVSEFDDRGGR